MMTAKELIKHLQLQPHPEGGYYRETYRSASAMKVNGKNRNVSTCIYYLLEDNDKSHFHRIQSDELWFFHMGEPLEIVTLKSGKGESILLGNNFENGEVLQAMIPAQIWFGSRIKTSKGFSLVSCTVAPGFDFADFEVAKRKDLLKKFPQMKELINNLALD